MQDRGRRQSPSIPEITAPCVGQQEKVDQTHKPINLSSAVLLNFVCVFISWRYLVKLQVTGRLPQTYLARLELGIGIRRHLRWDLKKHPVS